MKRRNADTWGRARERQAPDSGPLSRERDEVGHELVLADRESALAALRGWLAERSHVRPSPTDWDRRLPEERQRAYERISRALRQHRVPPGHWPCPMRVNDLSEESVGP